MKGKVSLLLAVSLLMSLLSGCLPPAEEANPPASSPAVEAACSDIVSGIWSRLGIGMPAGSEYYGLEPAFDSDSFKSPEEMNAYIQGAYGLDEGEWEEACIVREGGMSAVELAALRFADEDTAQHGYDLLKEYLHAREGDFTGYAPAQAKLAADAALVMEGLYVGLFIVENNDYARQVFTTMVQTGEAPEPTPSPEPTEPLDDVKELLEKLLAFCEAQGDDVSNLERVDGSDPDRLNSIIEEEYKLADYPWEEAVIARGTNGSAFEIAVLRAAEGQDAWRLCSALTQDYLDVKEDNARFPAQAELLSKAIAINPNGTNFVILAVCAKPDGAAVEAIQFLGTNGYSSAQRHFETASRPSFAPDPGNPDRVRFVQPGKDDMSVYDTSAIRAAWEKGDPAGLPDSDRAVYDAAGRILKEIITDGMTGLEKETAIYRWLVNSVDYDWRHQDIMMETPRTSYQPYGGLVDRTAVCLGYAASFQLLCDLTGVECITVVGAAFNSEEDHAWNMVWLDGQWYCVDVTWDANYREQGASSGQQKDWRWFNVTSDRMAKTDHQWDYANTPEAAVEDGGRS